MKKIIIRSSITVFIISLIVILILTIINNFQKSKIIKENDIIIGQTEIYISDLNQQIKELKNKSPVKIKEFVKLTDKEKEKAYQDLSNNYNKAIEIIDQNKKVIENLNKQLEKTTKVLKRKDLVFISGIAGIGLDQEFSLTGQIGGTVNGKVYSGLFTKIYLGGGGTYTIRYNLQEIVNGGNFIFNAIFFIGK